MAHARVEKYSEDYGITKYLSSIPDVTAESTLRG